jgi:hypothetical protein
MSAYIHPTIGCHIPTNRKKFRKAVILKKLGKWTIFKTAVKMIFRNHIQKCSEKGQEEISLLMNNARSDTQSGYPLIGSEPYAKV